MRRYATIAFVEYIGIDVRQSKFFEVLAAHTLIGSKHYYFVNADIAIESLGAVHIEQILQYVDVHYQRFSAAGGTHICKFVHSFFRIWLNVQCTEGAVAFTLNEVVERFAESLAVFEIAVEIHFGEKQCHILEIFQINSATVIAYLSHIAADALVVFSQLVV